MANPWGSQRVVGIEADLYFAHPVGSNTFCDFGGYVRGAGPTSGFGGDCTNFIKQLNSFWINGNAGLESFTFLNFSDVQEFVIRKNGGQLAYAGTQNGYPLYMFNLGDPRFQAYMFGTYAAHLVASTPNFHNTNPSYMSLDAFKVVDPRTMSPAGTIDAGFPQTLAEYQAGMASFFAYAAAHNSSIRMAPHSASMPDPSAFQQIFAKCPVVTREPFDVGHIGGFQFYNQLLNMYWFANVAPPVYAGDPPTRILSYGCVGGSDMHTALACYSMVRGPNTFCSMQTVPDEGTDPATWLPIIDATGVATSAPTTLSGSGQTSLMYRSYATAGAYLNFGPPVTIPLPTGSKDWSGNPLTSLTLGTNKGDLILGAGAVILPGGGGGGPLPSSAIELVPTAPAIAGAGYDISNSPQGTFAFEHGGSQYAFLCENGVPAAGGFGGSNGDVSVHALKSTDNGTTWIEQDFSHAVSIIYTANGSNAYTVAVDGTNVIVLNVVFASGGGGDDIITGLQTTTFDLTTDTWGSSNAHTTSIVDYMGFDTSLQGHELLVKLLVRGPGDYVLFHSGTQEVSSVTGHNLARVYYTTFNGSSYGTPVELPGQSGSQYYFNGTSACVDSSGRVHFFYQNNHFVTLGNPLFHVGLDGGGTFGTMQTVTNAIYYTTNISTGQCSEPIVFSGTIAIAANVAIPGFDQNIWLFYAAEALDPVWNTSVINTDQSNEPSLPEFYLEPQDIALAFGGGVLVCVWTVAGHPGTYWYSSSPPTAFTWTAAALLFTEAGSNMFAYQVYAWAMSAGIGVLGFGESTSDTEEAQFFAFVPSGFTGGGGGGPPPPVPVIPFRIIVDLYGDTQLSAIIPVAPSVTLPAVVLT